MARRPHETSSPRSEGSEPDEAAPCAEVASDVAVAVSPEGAELSSPYPPPNPPPVGRPVRIYADGIFDLFHFGHARALEQAKKSFPSVYLIVGVCDDATTHAYKGKTVMTETERYEALRHCRWVDEVVQSAPWVVTPAFLEAHSIDYVAHDALPYADASGQSDDVYGPVKLLGRFWETKRTEGVSTSDLILRIVRDYNDYVLRNLSRGYTREQLGLSLLQEQRIRAKERVKSISKTFRGIADPSARRAATEELRKKLATRVDRNVAGLARNVEGLVDRVASGALGEELAGTTDRLLSGFVASFERTYSKIERSIKARLGKRARNGAPRAPGRSGGAASDATLSESSSPGRDAVTTADEDDDDADDDGFVDLDDETKRAGSPRRRSHRHPRSGGGANAFQHALWGGRVRRSESATSLEASSPGETSRSDDDQGLGDDATKPHEKHAANSPTRNAADGPATRGKSARLESDGNDDDDDDHDENDDASRAKAAKRLKAAQTKGGRAAPKAPRAVAAV